MGRGNAKGGGLWGQQNPGWQAPSKGRPDMSYSDGQDVGDDMFGEARRHVPPNQKGMQDSMGKGSPEVHGVPMQPRHGPPPLSSLDEPPSFFPRTPCETPVSNPQEPRSAAPLPESMPGPFGIGLEPQNPRGRESVGSPGDPDAAGCFGGQHGSCSPFPREPDFANCGAGCCGGCCGCGPSGKGCMGDGQMQGGRPGCGCMGPGFNPGGPSGGCGCFGAGGPGLCEKGGCGCGPYPGYGSGGGQGYGPAFGNMMNTGGCEGGCCGRGPGCCGCQGMGQQGCGGPGGCSGCSGCGHGPCGEKGCFGCGPMQGFGCCGCGPCHSGQGCGGCCGCGCGSGCGCGCGCGCGGQQGPCGGGFGCMCGHGKGCPHGCGPCFPMGGCFQDMRRPSDFGFSGESMEATPSFPSSCPCGVPGSYDHQGSCGFKGKGGCCNEKGCQGPCHGKGCGYSDGLPMSDAMWMMGPNGVPPCSPMGPPFHMPMTPQEQGKGPPPYNADDLVEDRDLFPQSQWGGGWGKGDRWKGKGGGKKGGKGKHAEDNDRFEKLSPQERKRQWDQQRDRVKAALESGNLTDLWFALQRGWHPCAGSFSKKLRETKNKLKKIDLVVVANAGGRERGSPRKGQKRGARQREQAATLNDEPPSLQAKWFVHAPSQQDSPDPYLDAKSAGGFLERDKEGANSDLAPDLREIQLKLKGTIPAGCLLKIQMNGRETELKPEIRSKRGEVCPAESHEETTFQVRRPEPEPEAFEGVADPSSSASIPRGGLSFVPCIEFDACALVARTDIKLLTPTIELVEVHDTAVVLSLRNLTGQRFELTVYASGAEAPGVASTLVQCGPVRGSESVHRISPLEASQVYVAWVKVFSDSKTAESKQKGFKTLEAKQKTIWDEKDHVILGVAEDATAKEIVKAWRSKSLQYHPDKVPDEQKEEAEDMMKRLNLAKQNMMKFARPTPEQGENSPTAEATPEDDEDVGNFDAEEAGPAEPSPEWNPDGSDPPASAAPEDASEASDSEDSTASEDEEAETNKTRNEADVKDGRLRCSLTVQATQPPRLKVLERGYTVLVLEASCLPVGCHVQVLKAGDDDIFREASEKKFAKTSSLRFMLSGLEENTSYRLRLRTSMAIEPLRFMYSELAQPEPDQMGTAEEDDLPVWTGVATANDDAYAAEDSRGFREY